jgi:23S rRNA pseudouridine2605 synthase
MNPKTPAGRPESAPGDDPYDFDDEVGADDAEGGPGASAGIRLNKYLAQNGIASRRKADELITRGHVTIDGKLATELGRRVDPARETVEVDGVVLRAEGERLAYYLLNKPKGVVCTSDVREARPRAIDLVTDKKKGRIFTVGRLDEDTEGLVILTNDGEFANRISHPRFGVKKTYWVDVRGRVDEAQLEAMQRGVRLSEGWGTFERVKVIKRTSERTILLVTLSEGKNREVRRVLAALDLPVKSLRRVEIGPLRDKRLKTGQWRFLTRAEVGELLGASAPAAGASTRIAAKPAASARRPWSRQKPQRDDVDRRRGPRSRGPERGGRAGRREKRRG